MRVLLSWFFYLFYRFEICLFYLIFFVYVLSDVLGSNSFILCEIFVKIINANIFIKLYDKKWSIFHLTKVSYIVMLSKIFLEVPKALFGVKEFLNSPKTKSVSSFSLFFEFVNIRSVSFHQNYFGLL